MRLLQSRLPCDHQTQKPQRKFLTHLFGLLLMLPGHMTFRNLSRYSSYHAKTFARWYTKGFDFVALNKAAITAVVPPEHAQALVMDASFVPKSGKATYGLDRFWNGSHSRTEKGLEISALAGLDITDNCAYCLSAEQTPPAAKATDAEATRIDVYLEQLARVVSEYHLRHLRYVITDGYYSKQKFLRGVRALGLEQIGKLRLDANLRARYQGPQRSGPGRPKTYNGKVSWDNLSHIWTHPRCARTSACDSLQDHDCTHIYGLFYGGHVGLLALMDSALSLLNSLTTFDGLCDNQDLEELVAPVLPSRCHCPCNRQGGMLLCRLSPASLGHACAPRYAAGQ